MIYWLEIAGAQGKDIAYDVRTKSNAYAGIISWKGENGFAKVYFNSNATRGSTRKFPSIEAALEFIHARREKRGMNLAAA